jgi:putative radical SAM enzyme (TIGR03279 family)
MSQIKAVEPGSPASQAGVLAGETLLQVGKNTILDVLDYKYFTYDPELTLQLQNAEGKKRTVTLTKEPGEDLGLVFDTYLMDRARPCANKCVFCFVDQLPKDLRESLYFKDDDARLSFLMGNYITMTNLSKREIQRIIDLHISPINISVHATEPELRTMLLGSRRGAEGFEIIRRFAEAKIIMNCQIVACPGLNDGPALQRSMEDLAGLYPEVNSVSIVPVGLTKWREGLYPLRPYSKEEAVTLIGQVEAFGAVCKKDYGSTLFWCSDEFYLKAEIMLPEDEYYEDYAQLENGVGMLRLLEVEFRGASIGIEEVPEVMPFAIATGVAAAPFLREMIDRAAVKCHTKLNYTIYPIRNLFFGETIDVAGLITGGDLISQLKGKALGNRLLIAKNMLRYGETVFLDDVTIAQVERELGVPIVAVGQDGFELYEAVFGVV